MALDYVFLPKAQAEFEDAVSWYLSRSRKAGIEFVKSVDKTLALICEFPKRWQIIHKNFRELNTRKFPYTIVYTLEEERDIILIVSVFHHKRNPEKKFSH